MKETSLSEQGSNAGCDRIQDSTRAQGEALVDDSSVLQSPVKLIVGRGEKTKRRFNGLDSEYSSNCVVIFSPKSQKGERSKESLGCIVKSMESRDDNEDPKESVSGAGSRSSLGGLTPATNALSSSYISGIKSEINTTCEETTAIEVSENDDNQASIKITDKTKGNRVTFNEPIRDVSLNDYSYGSEYFNDSDTEFFSSLSNSMSVDDEEYEAFAREQKEKELRKHGNFIDRDHLFCLPFCIDEADANDLAEIITMSSGYDEYLDLFDKTSAVPNPPLTPGVSVLDFRKKNLLSKVLEKKPSMEDIGIEMTTSEDRQQDSNLKTTEEDISEDAPSADTNKDFKPFRKRLKKKGLSLSPLRIVEALRKKRKKNEIWKTRIFGAAPAITAVFADGIQNENAEETREDSNICFGRNKESDNIMNNFCSDNDAKRDENPVGKNSLDTLLRTATSLALRLALEMRDDRNVNSLHNYDDQHAVQAVNQ